VRPCSYDGGGYPVMYVNLFQTRDVSTVLPSIEQGFFLLEALIAILIFSLGVLGMVALGTVAISAQNDAQYRTEAANFASDIASEMQLTVGRVSFVNANNVSMNVVDATELASFEHLPGGPTDTPCGFSGSASTNAVVTAWLDRLTAAKTGLPGTSASAVQIQIRTGANGFNQANITVCWQAPSDKAQRKHTLVTYIN
jgi:type IV pilus assembly protein PilV